MGLTMAMKFMSIDQNGFSAARIRRSYRAWQKVTKARRIIAALGVAAVLALAASRVMAFQHGTRPPGFLVVEGLALLGVLVLPRLVTNLVWDLWWNRRYR